MKGRKKVDSVPLGRIGELSRGGMGVARIAGKIGMKARELHALAGERPDVKEALRQGEAAMMRVDEAIFKMATGYTVKVRKHYKEVRRVYDENGKKVSEEEVAVPKEDEVYVHPSVQAAIFWANYRQPPDWGKEPEPDEQLVAAAKALLGKGYAEVLGEGEEETPGAPPLDPA